MTMRRLLLVGVAVSLLLAGGLSYYASGQPDGLEYVAGRVGFLDSARDSATANSPLADYGVRGVEHARLSGGLAGVIGVLVTGLVMGGLVLLLRRLARRSG
ncbi:MAG: PDGLE domain-containing protein [Dermatophilaceae bacterium]